MVNWFESCFMVKLRKKAMTTEQIMGLVRAFVTLHIYANYTTNTIVLVGDSQQIDDLVTLLRYQKKLISTTSYSIIQRD